MIDTVSNVSRDYFAALTEVVMHVRSKVDAVKDRATNSSIVEAGANTVAHVYGVGDKMDAPMTSVNALSSFVVVTEPVERVLSEMLRPDAPLADMQSILLIASDLARALAFLARNEVVVR